MLILVAEQTINHISTDATAGIVGTLLGTIIGAVLGLVLQRYGALRFSIRDYHGKYYDTNEFGIFDKVVKEGDADGFGFQCNLHVFNSKSVGVSIDKAVIVAVLDNKEKHYCEASTTELHNIPSNELKIQTVLVRFQPEKGKITIGSVKKVFIEYYINGSRFKHRKNIKIKFKK